MAVSATDTNQESRSCSAATAPITVTAGDLIPAACARAAMVSTLPRTVRCRAVVQLRLLDTPLADATALAQKLDARLQEVAC